MIKDVYDLIAIKHSGYPKIINLIARNYYWLGLKKVIQYYI